MTIRPSSPVDLLILGAGWTSTFLIPLLQSENISYAATSTSGREGTIPFNFDPDDDDNSTNAQYRPLPQARTILITFPLRGSQAPRSLTDRYSATHDASDVVPSWILLGSTGIWTAQGVTTRQSAYDTSNARAEAEDALLAHKPESSTVLNLAGLYGGTRVPRTWLSRVAKTVEAAKGKTSLHLIHGEDVARVIVAVHDRQTWDKVKGKRWILTDLRVYDWWDLMFQWGGEVDGMDVRAEVGKWFREAGVGALPREKSELGRWVDARETWEVTGILPSKGLADVLG